jgi:hypothetical protein
MQDSTATPAEGRRSSVLSKQGLTLAQQSSVSPSGHPCVYMAVKASRLDIEYLFWLARN